MGKFIQLELTAKAEQQDNSGNYSITFDGHQRKIDTPTLRFNVEVGAEIPVIDMNELNSFRIHSIAKTNNSKIEIDKEVMLWVLYYSNFYAELSQALAAGSGEPGEKFADYFAGMYFSSVKPEDHTDTLNEILSDPELFIKQLEAVKNSAEKTVVNEIVEGLNPTE